MTDTIHESFLVQRAIMKQSWETWGEAARRRQVKHLVREAHKVKFDEPRGPVMVVDR